MNATQRTLSLLALSTIAFVLAACDQSKPPTVGERIDAGIERTQDMTITAKVKSALAGDDQLSALAINVDTTNKVVTLTGPAPTQAAFDRASALAQAVAGVAEVKNRLTVAGKG